MTYPYLSLPVFLKVFVMLGLPPFTALESSDFPGPFTVQLLLPFLHWVSVVTANAERALTERAATRKAANASIMRMRFIFSVSFAYTRPTSINLRSRRVGCEFAGAGRLVCASL